MAAHRTVPYAVASAAGLALCLSLAGCLADPPPDPRDAPLEVVLDSCTLNRASVQVGSHDVAVIGAGTVEIIAPDGRVALTVESAGGEVAEQRSALQMGAGTWQIACQHPSADRKTATLRVDPAS